MTNLNYNRNPLGIGGWKKGQSGNPGGRPSYGLNKMIRARSPELVDKMFEILENKNWLYPRYVQARVLEVLLERAWGKARGVEPDGEDVENMTAQEMRSCVTKYFKNLDDSIQENVDQSNQKKKRKKKDQ